MQVAAVGLRFGERPAVRPWGRGRGAVSEDLAGRETQGVVVIVFCPRRKGRHGRRLLSSSGAALLLPLPPSLPPSLPDAPCSSAGSASS